MLTPEGRKLRALVAVVTRHHGPNSPEVDDARRALRTAKAVATLRELVHSAPPLHPHQLDRIAAAVREPEAVQHP